jgi:nucleoside-diphosphate-sugar epimerase
VNILLIGGAGYVGSVLAERLAARGHLVRIADLFLFAEPRAFTRFAQTNVIDARHLTREDFAGVDAVLNLAALSNDPAGELNPEATSLINVEARVRAAMLARDAGVRRYILFSSCSVYGASEAMVDETAALNPLTAYAAANVHAETSILELNSDGFAVTVLRLATVFGVSPAMRFDLAVNAMTLDAFSKGLIRVNGDGLQYRPFIHVEDVASVVETVLGASDQMIGGEVFNIVDFNLKIRDLAERLCALFAGAAECEFLTNNLDFRNYHVNGARAEQVLGFKAAVGLEKGAADIRAALQQGRIKADFASARLNGYRRLVETMDMVGPETVNPLPPCPVDVA